MGVKRSGIGVFIFYHIPKTGGTSLGNYLANFCFKNKTAALSNNSPRVNTRIRTRLIQGGIAPTIEYVWGHNALGVHHGIKDSRKHKYLTLLRDPFERAISSYHHLKRLPYTDLSKIAYVNSFESLEEYFAIGDFKKGLNALPQYFSSSQNDLVDDAVKICLNMEVGFLDDLPEYCTRLRSKYGFDFSKKMLMRNVGEYEIPDLELKDLYYELNPLDLEFYNRILDAYDKPPLPHRSRG